MSNPCFALNNVFMQCFIVYLSGEFHTVRIRFSPNPHGSLSLTFNGISKGTEDNSEKMCESE